MPPTATKYTYTAGITFTIVTGNTSDDANLAINLAIQDDDTEAMEYVNPDTVVCNISAIYAAGQNVSPWIEVTRYTPANGMMRLDAHIATPVAANVTIVCNVAAIYWHSIQGTDHTP